MQGFHPQKNKTPVKSYANGGIVKGTGTGTSDDVSAMVPSDGYIMPADSTQALGFKPGMRPAKVSNGEAVLTGGQVQDAGGFEALDAMKRATHTPVLDKNMVETPKFFFANGTDGDELRKPFVQAPPVTRERDVRQAEMAAAASQQEANRAATNVRYADTGAQEAAAARAAFSAKISNSGFRPYKEQPVATPSVATPNPTAAPPSKNPASAQAGFPVQARPLTENPIGMPAKPGTPAAQAAMQTATPQLAQTQSLPQGVYQHGRGQYSDTPGGMGFKPGFTGKPSAQNDAAAEQLAQQSSARGFTPQSTESSPQVFIPQQDTGGYGLLDRDRIATRNAMIDVKQGDPGADEALNSILQRQTNAPGQQIERDKLAADVVAKNAERALRADDAQSARGFRAGQLANETARTGIEGQKAASEIEARGFEVNQAKRMQKLQDDYLNAKTPEEQVGAAKKLQALSGKQDQANRFTVVPGGQEYDSTAGVMRNVPARVLNNQTGQFVDGGQQSSQGGPKAIKSQAERDALPKGTVYIGPDGITKTKS